jgi:hypothetical protein
VSIVTKFVFLTPNNEKEGSRVRVKKMEQKIIGRKDKADLPDFGLEQIGIKIDSGAYSCSVDCCSIEVVQRDGKEQLQVVFLNPLRKAYTGEKKYFPSFLTKKVTSSTGNAQIRYFIQGVIVLFGTAYPALFSLSNRSGMRSPVLIGRKLLNHRFVIDTAKVNLSHKNLGK